MKKYKLKKWYPSLSSNWKKGDIVEESWTPLGVRYIVKDKIGNVSINEVENNPEFWEEVVEKDYEILSFKDQSEEEFARLFSSKHHKPFRSTTSGCRFTEEELLSQKGCDIHSVKRLSDGEVFTVGDTVKNQFGVYTITKFKEGKLGKGKLIVHTDGNNAYLSDTEHYEEKKPLFTTNDGVDIYEGDKYYNAFLKSKKVFCWKGTKDRSHLSPFDKTFSTEEKAKEYIEEHKPLYSKADIERAIKSSRLATEDLHEGTLRRALDS